MQPIYNQQDYIRYNYKNQLKRDSSTVGTILILFFVVMTAMSFATVFIPTILILFSNNPDSSALDELLMEDYAFTSILNGFVSLVTFFGVSIIYCLIKKVDLGQIFPLSKTPPKMMYLLCSLGLAICMIANYVSNALIAVFDMFGIDALFEMDYGCENALDIVLAYVTVALLPALVEEFAFRGAILGVLRKHSDSLAVLVSGIAFGLMHGNFVQIPFATVVGLILGFIAVKTNSLLPGIIIHFLNNGISVTLSLLVENTSLSDMAVNFINLGIMLVIGIFGIISFVILSTKHKGFFKLYSDDKILSFKEKLKTVCSSATVIIFIVISLFEAVAMLFLEV